jgi:TonB-linked SusC/RagA family outer membrane protein
MGKKYILEKFSPHFSVKQLFRIEKLTTLVLFLGIWLMCTQNVFAGSSNVNLKANAVNIHKMMTANNLLPAPVTGVVTDSKGATLPGVTVRVKGTGKATITNSDGKFTIDVPSAQTVLVFTSMGYMPEEINVGSQKTLTVVLKDAIKALDEVVVVGYGTQKKGSITGAVSQIRSEEILKSPSVAATSALVGKVAGITARSYDSRPGNGTSIQIRNLGTPLYVIDGVPYSTSDGTSGFGFNTDISGQNFFNQLGLEDIESVSILKDASASVYGLRASNGVVLVTTKKGGRSEQPTINVNGYTGVQNFTRYYDVANAGQYVTALVQSNQNRGQTPAYSQAEVAKWVAGTDSGYQNNDYKKIMLRPNVPQSYISVNASGGSARTNYYFSISNLNQDALLKEYKFSRTNLQSNISTKLAKGLTIGTQIAARIEKHDQVGVPGLDDYFNPLLSISSMWPTETMYANNNPLYINQTHNVNVNPATYTKAITGYTMDITRAVNVNLNAQYDFNFGLTAKGIYSYNYTNEDFDGFEYTYPAYIYNATTKTYNDRPTGGSPYGNQNPWREIHKNNIVSRFAQFSLNYAKQLGDHNISAVAAFEHSDMENYYVAIHSIPPTNYIPTILFANQDYLGYSWTAEARAGYVGRFNYNFKQKYLLEVLGRYDGSFAYRSDHRWGLFPGVSGGWRVSEEPFFKKFAGKIFTNFKLRASYGVTGNESGTGFLGYLPGYPYPSGSAIFDGNYVIGIQPQGTLPITNLTWVKNQTANIGIDFTTLGDKLTGQFDVFT